MDEEDEDKHVTFDLPRSQSRASKRILEHIEKIPKDTRISQFFVHDPDKPRSGLEALQETDRICLVPAPEGTQNVPENTRQIYNLLGSTGQLLFNLIHTFHYENCQELLHFDMTLLDPHGGGLMAVKGNSTHVTICSLSNEGHLHEAIGTVMITSHKLLSKETSHMDLIDIHSGERFLISQMNAVGDMRGEFVISDSKTGAYIGKITKGLPAEVAYGEDEDGSENLNLVPVEVFGIQFDKTLNNRTKGLLMGTLVYIYFQTYDLYGELRVGALQDFQTIFCIVFTIVVFLMYLTLLILLIVAFSVEGFRQNT